MDGDTIQFSSGTYVLENQNGTGALPYTINGMQNGIQIVNKNINLVGSGENSTILQAPPFTTPLTQNFTYNGIIEWCIVMVDNQGAPTPQTVNISALTIDGSTQQNTTTLPVTGGYYSGSNRYIGIGYHNASGTIQNVHVTNTTTDPTASMGSQFYGQLSGVGIFNGSDTGTVTFNVNDCLIDYYQRGGIDCRGAALTVNLTNNVINRGYVFPAGYSAATPNGIELSGSSVGVISNNSVEGNIASVAGSPATGIFSITAGSGVIISNNILTNNDTGVVGVSNGGGLIISNNTVEYTVSPPYQNDPWGIYVQDTAGLTTLSSNIMNNIPSINMQLLDTSTNEPFQLMNNQFIGSQTGLLITGNTTTGPQVTMNGDSFTGTIGYYIEEVSDPNNIWPSTATVSFDGLFSGHITLAEYNQILAKIVGEHVDPALGVVLDYIMPIPPTLTNINPTFGPTVGGNTITITGSSFLSSNTMVYFGATPGTNVVVVSNTEITVTVPAGSGAVDVTVVTPFGTTPIVPAGQYTYIEAPPPAPLPPSNFIGVVKKNKFLNKTEYELRAQWDASPSTDVILYRIYKNGHLVDEVLAGSPLVFVTCVDSRNAAKKYQIVAVNSDNLESTPVSIRIVHD